MMPSAPGSSSRKLPDWTDGVALFALALGMRLYALGRQQPWTDELFTLYWSKQPLSFLLGEGLRLETNPPGPYLLAKLAMHFAGDGPAVARSPFALASAAAALALWQLARTLGESRASAALAGLFAALSPELLLFGQQARGYSTLVLCETLAMLGLALALERGAPLASRNRGRALAVLGSAASVWFGHYSALAFAAAWAMPLAISLWRTRPFERGEARRWLLAMLPLALALVPAALLARTMRGSVNLAWIGPITPRSLELIGIQLVTREPSDTHGVRALFALFLLACSLLGLRRFGARGWLICAIAPLLELALLIAASLSHPMLITRAVLGLLPPLYLLAARGLALAPRRMLPASAAAALAICGIYLYMDIRCYREGYVREDWRGAARALREEPDCRGPVLYAGAYGLGLRSADPALAPRLRASLIVPAIASWTASAESKLDERVNHLERIGPERLPEVLAGQPDNALVTRLIIDQRLPAELRPWLARARKQLRLEGLEIYCGLPPAP